MKDMTFQLQPTSNPLTIWAPPQQATLKFVRASEAYLDCLGLRSESCQPDVLPFIDVVMILVLIADTMVLYVAVSDWLNSIYFMEYTGGGISIKSAFVCLTIRYERRCLSLEMMRYWRGPVRDDWSYGYVWAGHSTHRKNEDKSPARHPLLMRAFHTCSLPKRWLKNSWRKKLDMWKRFLNPFCVAICWVGVPVIAQRRSALSQLANWNKLFALFPNTWPSSIMTLYVSNNRNICSGGETEK